MIKRDRSPLPTGVAATPVGSGARVREDIVPTRGLPARRRNVEMRQEKRDIWSLRRSPIL